MTENTEQKKGLFVNILKPHYGSCDNGNFSSKLSSVIVIASPMFPKIPEISSVTKETPAVMILSKRISSNDPEYLRAYPVGEDGFADTNCMFGGTYIMTSDSRFPFYYPIPLHDRKE